MVGVLALFLMFAMNMQVVQAKGGKGKVGARQAQTTASKKHPVAKAKRNGAEGSSRRLEGKEKAVQRRLEGKEKAIQRRLEGKEKAMQRRSGNASNIGNGAHRGHRGHRGQGNASSVQRHSNRGAAVNAQAGSSK